MNSSMGPQAELPEPGYFEHTHLGCYICATLTGLACCVGSYNSQYVACFAPSVHSPVLVSIGASALLPAPIAILNYSFLPLQHCWQPLRTCMCDPSFGLELAAPPGAVLSPPNR
eukprot:1156745-Pelagomonas_calceolata.AAC.11